MSAAARRYPFLTSTVLIPRWVLLEAGMFNEALRRGQDTELFFRLGLRDTKAVAIADRLTTRRVDAESLSARQPSSADRARIALSQVLCLAATPGKWGPHSIPAIRRLFFDENWPALAEPGERDLEHLKSRLFETVKTLEAKTGGAAGAMPLLIRQLADELERAESARPDLSGDPFIVALKSRVQAARDAGS